MGVRWIGESEALEHVSQRTLRRWRKERGLTIMQERLGRKVVTLVDGDEFYRLLNTVMPGKHLT